MGLSASYILRRLLVFIVVVWAAATINFIIPRLVPGDPITVMVSEMAATERIENAQQLMAEYRAMFGLNESVWLQYVKYLANSLRLEFGFSYKQFPLKVADLIWGALPWTVGFLGFTVLISFTVGTLLGALIVWRGKSPLLQALVMPLTALNAVPYYLLAVILLYLFAYTWKVLPTGGIATIGAQSGWNQEYVLDVLRHMILPSASMILAGMGRWILGMRGMMVTTMGADYLALARAKGLSKSRIFLRYGVRNAILPQVTGLVITLGHIVTGAILLERIFGLPGVGYLLFQGITYLDYPLIQGTTFMLVLSTALSILLLDLIYPRLDPRITYTRR